MILSKIFNKILLSKLLFDVFENNAIHSVSCMIKVNMQCNIM